MKTFKQYDIENSSEYRAVVEMIQFMEYVDNDFQETLSEGLLDKIGLSAHKGDGGLLKIVKNAGITMVKLFAAVIKGDKETAKAIANTEIKKEDVIDFLLKLDQATLHILTGPIHTLEAITGWHIWAKVSKHASDVAHATVDSIKDATKYIKSKVAGLSDKAAKKIIANAERIEKLALPPLIQS